MNSAAAIDRAFEKAVAKLESVDGDLSRLSPTVRTFLVVHEAQGVIDNGGYRYFFGADWPGNTPYGEFVSAYEAIGCVEQAADLARVVGTFPFSEPHLHADARDAFIEKNYDPDDRTVRGWGDALCGDEVVWKHLADFCLRNSAELL